jgi:hypothetical protein
MVVESKIRPERGFSSGSRVNNGTVVQRLLDFKVKLFNNALHLFTLIPHAVYYFGSQ